VIDRDPQTSVRKMMNGLMGMKRDVDIVDVDLATEDEVTAFERGDVGSTDPDLQPLRPYLEGNVRCGWNSSLGEMFLVHWEENQGERLGAEEARAIEDRFEKRLENLKKARARILKHSKEELRNEMARSRHISRVSGRRDRVSQFIPENRSSDKGTLALAGAAPDLLGYDDET